MLDKEYYIEHIRRMKEEPGYKEKVRRENLLDILQDWKRMNTMKIDVDIPDLPVLDDKIEWNSVFVPILIEKGAI